MGHDPIKMLGQTVWIVRGNRWYHYIYLGGLPNEVLHAFSAAPIFQYLTNVEGPDQQTLF